MVNQGQFLNHVIYWKIEVAAARRGSKRPSSQKGPCIIMTTRVLVDRICLLSNGFQTPDQFVHNFMASIRSISVGRYCLRGIITSVGSFQKEFLLRCTRCTSPHREISKKWFSPWGLWRKLLIDFFIYYVTVGFDLFPGQEWVKSQNESIN